MRLEDTIIYADFDNKILIGKCKAKDLQRKEVDKNDMEKKNRFHGLE
jgi:hypothetical protein